MTSDKIDLIGMPRQDIPRRAWAFPYHGYLAEQGR